jgi:hypothetical protein
VRVHGPACERERDLGHLVEVTHDFKHHLPRQNFESPQIGPGSEVGDEVCVQMSAEGWQLLQEVFVHLEMHLIIMVAGWIVKWMDGLCEFRRPMVRCR